MADRRRVGFIGVGLMGHGMAKNIVEKGYPLTVLGHRNRKPVEDLVGRGAREAESAAELALKSDVIFLCVTASPQVEQIMFGADGVLSGITPGVVVVDSTTADPESTLNVAAAVEAKGARFLDAPLVRTPKEAEEGRLGCMVGGDPALFEDVRPIIECFAESIVHAGGIGAGHRLKLINNYLALVSAAAVAEGLCAARKMGVDMEALVSVVTTGGADSVMFRCLAKYALEGDDSALHFALSNAQKDLRYYTHMAEAAPTTAFLAEAAHQLYVLANNSGRGNDYVPKLIDVLCRMNGVDEAVGRW